MDELIDLIPHILESRRYWFIRTRGGKYYQNFIAGNFIAIAWNEIKLSAIKNIKLSEKDEINRVSEIIAKDKTGKANFKYRPAIKQIIKFAHEIRKGDIVLIPSKNSETITFGEVLDDIVFSEDLSSIENMDQECPYEKRRQVKWLNTISRASLNAKLYPVTFSEHAISEADKYSEYIDKSLNSFYIKGNKLYIILDVGTNEGIGARDLFTLGLGILDKFDDYYKYMKDETYNSNCFETKIMLQSRGKIEFSTKLVVAGLILSILIGAITGGGIESKLKGFPVEVKYNGLIKNVIEYQNNSHERQMEDKVLSTLVNKLEVKNPEELEKVFKEIDKTN